jgi:hypothetical protein
VRLITIDNASKRTAYEIIKEKKEKGDEDQNMMGYPFDACLGMKKKNKEMRKKGINFNRKSRPLQCPYWCLYQDLPSSYFEGYKSCKSHSVCIFGEAYL